MGDEEKGPEQKDDLFEDLDKFFAPIRDVDWPETGEEPTARPAGGEPAREHVDVKAPARTEEPEEASQVEEEVEEPAEAEAGAGALFPEIAEEGEAAEEAEAEPEAGEGITVESFTAPPPEYEGLPGPTEEGEEVAAEAYEEPPDVSLEAAAEHFAESVRAEEGAAGEETAAWEDFAHADEEGEVAEPLEEETYEPVEVERDILSDLDETRGPRTVKVGGAEELTGPSWQDPSAPEIGLESERAVGQRDVPAAFLTGLVLAILAAGSLAIAPAVFAVVAGLVVLWAQGELYGVLHKQHHQPATALGLVGGALVLAAAYLRGESAMLAMLGLSLVAAFLWFMAVPAAHRKNTVVNVGLTMLGVGYVPLLAGFALVTLTLPDGRALVLTVIALTFIYDTAAFLFGSLWGGSFFQRGMAPSVSPKKTWEGAIAAALLVIGVSVAFVSSYVDLFEGEPLNALVLGLVVVVFATLGDLAESLLKRDLGVKDMGSVLPGHGGVLDRIDSLLFVAPAAFWFLRAIL